MFFTIDLQNATSRTNRVSGQNTKNAPKTHQVSEAYFLLLIFSLLQSLQQFLLNLHILLQFSFIQDIKQLHK